MDKGIYLIWIILVCLTFLSPVSTAASIDDIWKLTNEYGGGGFEGEINIPMTNSVNSWEVTIEFDKPVRKFKVYEAELVKTFENETLYIVENAIWNGFLDRGDDLYFRIQGFTDDVAPKLKVTFQGIVYEITPPPERVPPLSQTEMRKIINTDVDYEKAIRLSLLFIESQRSGFLSDDNRIPWKKSSGLYDGGLEGVNLIGGYYIAGDYVKFNFPMAFAITQLAWGALEFREGYENAGQMENLMEAVKWGTDYFMKCHVSPEEYYGMVGDPDIDHKLWESSQRMDWERPAFKLSPDEPGSDLAAETAAALAAASILFEKVAPDYSAKLIGHAIELWQFAEVYRGRYDFLVMKKAEEFYGSSGYDDELVWGAVWLYEATKDNFYLDFVESNYGRLSLDTKDGLSYDNKMIGIQLLMADITDDYRTYMQPVKQFCDEPGGSDAYVLPNGLLYKNLQNEPVALSSNAAFVCTILARRYRGSAAGEKYLSFAKAQTHIMLGTGNGQSFMIGFGNNYPHYTHHRDSSCPDPPQNCGWDFFHDSTIPNTNEIKGALVGGTDQFGVFDDHRENIKLNQPNLLYNAAFQSTLAGLIMFNDGEMESSGAGSGSIWETGDLDSTSLRKIFADSDIEYFFDACISNPCQNGGECINTVDMNFECICEENTYGTLCENKLNPEIEWVSTWPDGAQVHIHLPSKMYEGRKQLHLIFPSDCPLVLVEVWHTCLVPSISSLADRTIVMQQFGWQTNQKFLGIKFEIANPDFMQSCFKTSNFRFKISDQEIPNSPLCTKSIPEVDLSTSTTTAKPVYETIKPLKEDRNIDGNTIFEEKVLPTILAEKRVPDGADDEIFTWVNRWTSGGQAHINLKHIKIDNPGPWILRFLIPSQCSLSSAQFWHACAVQEMSNPKKGLFSFKQVGWQNDHNFIGMTLHFTTVIHTIDCFDTSQYHVVYEESTVGASLNPSTCKTNFEKEDMKAETSRNLPIPSFNAITIPNSNYETTPSPSQDEKPTPSPSKLRGLWIRRARPIPPPDLASVNRLRAKPVSSTTVQISWRKRKKNVNKMIQVEVAPQIENEEEQVEDVTKDDSKKKSASVVKLKHASSAAKRKFPAKPSKIDVSGQKRKIYVRNLLPGKTYNFTARVWDGEFYGPGSTITVTLAPADIQNIRTTNPDKTSLHFRWQKPLGDRQMYEVTYFPETSSSFPKSPFELSGESTETHVTGLEENTEYIFSFVSKSGFKVSDGKYVFAKTGSHICKQRACPQSSECTQTEDGFECVCDFGYKMVGGICQEINECEIRSICNEKAECVNTFGSYECRCKFGYHGDGVQCVDVDECSMKGIEVCPGADCKNTEGSYECTCEEGYTYKESSCRDDNECEVGIFKCPEESSCVNTNGSYTCECPKGMKYIDNMCQDVNECIDKTHNCKRSQICINTRGSYKCLCRKGLTKSKRGCRDLNECKMNTHKCSKYASCRNKRGGYKCSCKQGYVGNGVLCKDFDECLQPDSNNCDENNGICSNIPGTYVCSCQVGYTGNGSKCYPIF
uniref:uncharacterized protein LOC120328324 isoform X2 n=1 Tax=Styela clava TaxID=7725 RepID=UPI0019397AB6|nr:uncharacterized protein LOC120328324 isoform X2 [Styela clava]